MGGSSHFHDSRLKLETHPMRENIHDSRASSRQPRPWRPRERAGTAMQSERVVRDAKQVTNDYLALSSEKITNLGVNLVDRAAQKTIKVHSLVELELGRLYVTKDGNSLIRTSRHDALLAGKVTLPIDMDEAMSPRTSVCSADTPGSSCRHSKDGRDSPLSPLRRFVSEGSWCSSLVSDAVTPPSSSRSRSFEVRESSSLSSAMLCVRVLRAAPTSKSLAMLERTFARLPMNNDWLDSFLDLDGMQALIDVLSHTLARTTKDSENDRVQSRCVSCISILTSRRCALDSLLRQPLAVACLVTAIDVRSSRAQRGLLAILLRIALQPRGTAMLLAGWWANRGTDTMAPRLAPLVAHFAVAAHECNRDVAVGVLRLAYVMSSGPAGSLARAQVRQELSELKLLEIARRSNLNMNAHYKRIFLRLQSVIDPEMHEGKCDVPLRGAQFEDVPFASPLLYYSQLSAPLVIGHVSLSKNLMSVHPPVEVDEDDIDEQELTREAVDKEVELLKLLETESRSTWSKKNGQRNFMHAQTCIRDDVLQILLEIATEESDDELGRKVRTFLEALRPSTARTGNPTIVASDSSNVSGEDCQCSILMPPTLAPPPLSLDPPPIAPPLARPPSLAPPPLLAPPPVAPPLLAPPPIEPPPIVNRTVALPPAPPVPPAPTPPTAVRKSRLRPLHWRKLPQNVTVKKGSLWQKVASIDVSVDFDSLICFFSERMPRNFAALQSPRKSQCAPIEQEVSSSSPVSTAQVSDVGTPRTLRREQELTTFLTTKRAQHIQITLSRFRAKGEDPLFFVWQAVVCLDVSVLNVEDLPGLISCLPTDDEAAMLLSWKGHLKDLSQVDAFQWRSLSIPRLRQRLIALLAALQLEPVARILERDLDRLRDGCEQILASESLQCSLAITLAVGNAMNENVSRLRDARGFGLEALANSMSIRSTKDDHSPVTLLHFISRELTKHGITSSALRSELKHITEATRVDLESIVVEVRRLRGGINVLRKEVTIAACEFMRDKNSRTEYELVIPLHDIPETDNFSDSQIFAEPKDLSGVHTIETEQLEALCDALKEQLEEKPPVIGDVMDCEIETDDSIGAAPGKTSLNHPNDAISAFVTRRVIARLGNSIRMCEARVEILEEMLQRARQGLQTVAEAFGPAAEAVASGDDNISVAQQHILDLSNFMAAFEKAEKDNRREDAEEMALAQIHRKARDNNLAKFSKQAHVESFAIPETLDSENVVMGAKSSLVGRASQNGNRENDGDMVFRDKDLSSGHVTLETEALGSFKLIDRPRPPVRRMRSAPHRKNTSSLQSLQNNGSQSIGGCSTDSFALQNGSKSMDNEACSIGSCRSKNGSTSMDSNGYYVCSNSPAGGSIDVGSAAYDDEHYF